VVNLVEIVKSEDGSCLPQFVSEAIANERRLQYFGRITREDPPE
jgi:hypothetical protein